MFCKHYYSFDRKLGVSKSKEKLDSKDWDAMRTADIDSPFSIEETKEKWEANCESAVDYSACAKLIVDGVGDENKKLLSLGIGKGILEYHLKKLRPNWIIDGADYTPEAIKAIKKVFEKHDRLFCFNMVSDSYATMTDYDYIVLYRVSTEFDRDTWKSIFYNMKKDGVKNILFIPTEIMTEQEIFCKEKSNGKRFFRKQGKFAGWLYTEDEFLNMWKDQYMIEKEIIYKNTKIYFLVSE